MSSVASIPSSAEDVEAMISLDDLVYDRTVIPVVNPNKAPKKNKLGTTFSSAFYHPTEENLTCLTRF